MNTNQQQKTGFIAIIGTPNVGKSSIMNHLLGQKVAIVSPKPQTTRTRIMGVLTEGDIQLVFTDTPGFHRPKNVLGEKMQRAVTESIAGVDLCLLVTQAWGDISQEEQELIQKIKQEKIPAILAINKIDLVKNKENLIERIAMFANVHNFDEIIPLSARNGSGMTELHTALTLAAKEGMHLFPEDSLTDQPERALAAEMVREKLLRLLDKEIPHGTAVAVEKFKEREDSDILDISVTIYCERDSHKGIIIGKKGAMLKEVSTRARLDMERFFACRVNLQCWVKVKEDWRNKEGLIHNFGLDL